MLVEIPADAAPLLKCIDCDEEIPLDMASYEAGKLVGKMADPDEDDDEP